MRNVTIGLIVMVAALMLTAGAVAAQGNNTTDGHDEAPVNGTAAEWGAWMEQHMTEHMGADATERMQERMGMSYEQMGYMMKAMMGNDGMSGMMDGNGSGMGCH